jgi:hypothetical protein
MPRTSAEHIVGRSGRTLRLYQAFLDQPMYIALQGPAVHSRTESFHLLYTRRA